MVNNRFKLRAIIGGLFFVLLLIGTGVAYFLTQQNQDIRQQASGGCAVGDPYCSCDINGSNCTEVDQNGVRTIVDQGGDLNNKGILATSYSGDRATSQGGCSGVWQNDFCYMPGDELAGGYIVVENGRYNYPYFEQKERYESAEYGGETVNQNLGSEEQLGKDCGGQGLAINGTCYSYGSNVNGFLVMDARTSGCDNSTGDYCYAHLEKIDTNYDDWQKAVASYESNGDYTELEKLYEETYGLSFEVGGLFDPNAANAKQLRAQALITALTNADVLKGKAAEQNAALDELSKANGGLDEGQQSLYEFNQQLIAAENLDRRYQTLDQLTKSTGQQTAINQAISSMYGQLVAAENDEELKKITADRFEEIFGYDPIEKYGSTQGVLEVFGLNPAQLEADRKSYQQALLAEQSAASQLDPGISAPVNSTQQPDEQKKQEQALDAINNYLSGKISDAALAQAAGIPSQANLSSEALLSILFQKVGYDSSQSTDMAKDALSDKQTSSVIMGYLSGSKSKLDLAREAGLPDQMAYSMSTESILASLYRKLGDTPIVASEKASEVFAIKSDIIKEGILIDAYRKNPNSATAITNLYTYYTGDTGDPGKPGGNLNNLLTVEQMTTELAKRNSNIALQAYLNTGNLNYLKENYVVGKSVAEITNSGALDNELSLLEGIFGDSGKAIYNSAVLPVSLNNALNNFAQNPDELEAVCSRALGSACNLSESNATAKLDEIYRLAYGDRNSDNDPSNDINIAELSATQAQQLFRESKKEERASAWDELGAMLMVSQNMNAYGTTSLFLDEAGDRIEEASDAYSQAQADHDLAIRVAQIYNPQDTFAYASQANIRQDLNDYLYGGIMGDAFMNDKIFDRTYDLRGNGENGLGLSWGDANYMAFNQVRTQVFGQTELSENIATNYAMAMQQNYTGPANTRVADVAFQATQNLGGNYQSAFGLDYQAANNGYYFGKDITNAGATLADWSTTAATYAGLAMQGGDYSYSPSFTPQEMKDIAVDAGDQVGDQIRQNAAENYAETYQIDADAYITFNTDDEIVRSRNELNWETAEKVVAPTVAIVALPVAVASGAGIGIVTGVASGAWTFYQGAGQKAQAFELQRTVISQNADDGDNVAALSIAQTFMANDESLSYDQAYDKAIGQVEEQIQSTNKQANIMLASSAVAFINSGSGIIQGFTGAQSALTTSLSWAGRGGGVALSGVTAASAAQQVISVNEQLKNFEQTVAEQNLSAAEAEKLHKDLVSQRIFSSLSTGVAVIGGVGTSLNALTEVGAVTRSFGTAADMVIDSLSLPLGSAVDLQNISQSCFTSNYAADDTACRDAWVGLALSVTQDVTQIRNSSQARQNLNTSQSPDYIRSANQAQVEDYMQRISEVNRQIDISDLLNKPSGSMTPTEIARLTELTSLRAELSGKVLGIDPGVKIPDLAKPVATIDVQRLLDAAESNRLFLDDSANKLQNVDIDLAVKSLEQSEAQAEVVRLGTEINDLDNLAKQNLNLDASSEDVNSYRETRQAFVDELIVRVNDPVLRSADLNDNQRLIAAVQAQEGEIIKNYDAARKQAQSQAEELEKLNLPPPEDIPERKTGLAALLPAARKSNQAIDAYEQARVATVELERLQAEITRIGDEVVDLARNNASEADDRSRLSELRDLNRQYESAKKTAYNAVNKANSSLAAVTPETARQTIGDTNQDPGLQQPRTIAKVFSGLVGGTVDRIRSIPETIKAGSTRRQVAALKDLAQNLGTKNSDTVYQISLRQVEVDRLRSVDPVGNGAEIARLEGAINDLLRDSQSSLRGGNALIEVDRTQEFTTFKVTKVGEDAGLNNNQLKILNDSLKSFETFRRSLQSPQELADYGPFKIYSGTGSFKDQDVFLLAEIEAFGAGRRGTVFGALPGMGKTDVVMPFNVLLKQRLTDKPQFVVFPEAKLMKPWVIDDNYTPNKVFIDHVESEFGKGSVLIIRPNENVDPTAIARAKFIITIKDVAFDLQNTSTPTGLALRNKWGDSYVHADEVDWTFNPNESYKQSGRQVALTDKPEYQTYLDAQKVVLGIDENGQISGKGLASLRALVAEAEVNRSIPTGITKTEDGNAGKFADVNLERKVLSEWLDTWGGQGRITDLDMAGDLDVARQKIDEYLTNGSAEDLQQLRSQRAMINETVSFLSKVPNEDYGLTTRTETVGGAEEVISSISPREQGKLTGRSYSAVAEQLLYNSVGARVLGVADQVDLAKLTVGEGGSDINYALLMLESQGFSLYTGTPETVAKLYKMAYGIDLQVFTDSAVDDSIARFNNPPEGRQSGVFTTIEGQIAARLDDGENQVFIYAAQGLRANDEARSDLVNKVNDVVTQKRQSSPDYENPYKKFFLVGANGELTEYKIVGGNLLKTRDFPDIDSMNAETTRLDKTGERHIKFYELGAHIGVDTKNNVDIGRAVGICNGCDETIFGQAINRFRVDVKVNPADNTTTVKHAPIDVIWLDSPIKNPSIDDFASSLKARQIINEALAEVSFKETLLRNSVDGTFSDLIKLAESGKKGFLGIGGYKANEELVTQLELARQKWKESSEMNYLSSSDNMTAQVKLEKTAAQVRAVYAELDRLLAGTGAPADLLAQRADGAIGDQPTRLAFVSDDNYRVLGEAPSYKQIVELINNSSKHLDEVNIAFTDRRSPAELVGKEVASVTQRNDANADRVADTTQAVRDLNDVATNPIKLATNWNRMVRGARTLASLPANILGSIRAQDAEQQEYVGKQEELAVLELALAQATAQEKINISQQIQELKAELDGFKAFTKITAKLDEWWFDISSDFDIASEVDPATNQRPVVQRDNEQTQEETRETDEETIQAEDQGREETQVERVADTTQAVRDLNDVTTNPIKLATNWNRMIRATKALASLPASILGSIRAQDAEQQEYVGKQEELAALKIAISKASSQEEASISQQIQELKAELDGFKAFTKITAKLDEWWFDISSDFDIASEVDPATNQRPVVQRDNEQTQEETRQREEKTAQDQERVVEPAEQEQQDGSEETQTDRVANTTQATRDQQPSGNAFILQTNLEEGLQNGTWTEESFTDTSSHPIRKFRNTTTGLVVLVKESPDHTMRADFMSSLILSNAGLPSPKVEIAEINGKKYLISEFVEGAATGYGNNFPTNFSDYKSVQRAFLLDLLTMNYDRNAENILFSTDGSEISFIDNGASLGSSARGDYRDFPDNLNEGQIAQIMSLALNDSLVVNPAYAQIIDFEILKSEGRVVVKDVELMKELLEELNKVDDETINEIISEAFPERSVEEMIAEIEARKKYVEAYLANNPSSRYAPGAIAYCDNILNNFGGNESEYLRNALKNRRDSIDNYFQDLLTHAGGEDDNDGGGTSKDKEILRQRQTDQELAAAKDKALEDFGLDESSNSYLVPAIQKIVSMQELEELIASKQVDYQALKNQFKAFGITVVINNEVDYMEQFTRFTEIVTEIKDLEKKSGLTYFLMDERGYTQQDENGIYLTINQDINLSSFRDQAEKIIADKSAALDPAIFKGMRLVFSGENNEPTANDLAKAIYNKSIPDGSAKNKALAFVIANGEFEEVEHLAAAINNGAITDPESQKAVIDFIIHKPSKNIDDSSSAIANLTNAITKGLITDPENLTSAWNLIYEKGKSNAPYILVSNISFIDKYGFDEQVKIFNFINDNLVHYDVSFSLSQAIYNGVTTDSKTQLLILETIKKGGGNNLEYLARAIAYDVIQDESIQEFALKLIKQNGDSAAVDHLAKAISLDIITDNQKQKLILEAIKDKGNALLTSPDIIESIFRRKAGKISDQENISLAWDIVFSREHIDISHNLALTLSKSSYQRVDDQARALEYIKRQGADFVTDFYLTEAINNNFITDANNLAVARSLIGDGVGDAYIRLAQSYGVVGNDREDLGSFYKVISQRPDYKNEIRKVIEAHESKATNSLKNLSGVVAGIEAVQSDVPVELFGGSRGHQSLNKSSNTNKQEALDFYQAVKSDVLSLILSEQGISFNKENPEQYLEQISSLSSWTEYIKSHLRTTLDDAAAEKVIDLVREALIEDLSWIKEQNFDKLLSASLFIDKPFFDGLVLTGYENPFLAYDQFGQSTRSSDLGAWESWTNASGFDLESLKIENLQELHKLIFEWYDDPIANPTKKSDRAGILRDPNDPRDKEPLYAKDYQDGKPLVLTKSQINNLDNLKSLREGVDEPIMKFIFADGVTGPDENGMYVGFIEFCKAENVDEELRNLLEWYEKKSSTEHDPYLLAAELQQRFIAIHPFRDGNGRTSRWVMNWSLRRDGIDNSIIYDTDQDMFSSIEEWAEELRKGELRYSSLRNQMVTMINGGIPSNMMIPQVEIGGTENWDYHQWTQFMTFVRSNTKLSLNDLTNADGLNRKDFYNSLKEAVVKFNLYQLTTTRYDLGGLVDDYYSATYTNTDPKVQEFIRRNYAQGEVVRRGMYNKLDLKNRFTGPRDVLSFFQGGQDDLLASNGTHKVITKEIYDLIANVKNKDEQRKIIKEYLASRMITKTEKSDEFWKKFPDLVVGNDLEDELDQAIEDLIQSKGLKAPGYFASYAARVYNQIMMDIFTSDDKPASESVIHGHIAAGSLWTVSPFTSFSKNDTTPGSYSWDNLSSSVNAAFIVTSSLPKVGAIYDYNYDGVYSFENKAVKTGYDHESEVLIVGGQNTSLIENIEMWALDNKGQKFKTSSVERVGEDKNLLRLTIYDNKGKVIAVELYGYKEDGTIEFKKKLLNQEQLKENYIKAVGAISSISKLLNQDLSLNVLSKNLLEIEALMKEAEYQDFSIINQGDILKSLTSLSNSLVNAVQAKKQDVKAAAQKQQSQQESQAVAADKLAEKVKKSEVPIVRSMTVGRAADNEIQLHGAEVSGHHAEFVLLDDGRFLIIDSGSTNGLWVQQKNGSWNKVNSHIFSNADTRVAFSQPGERSIAEIVNIKTNSKGALLITPDGENLPRLEIKNDGSSTDFAKLRLEQSKINSSVATDVGNKYLHKEESERQQDAAGTFANPNLNNQRIGKLLMVEIDGTGGYGDGAKASRFLKERASEIYFNERTETDIRERLKSTLEQLHAELNKQGFANKAGAVMDLSVISEDEVGELLHVAHVGDTQTWVLRNGAVKQLTKDQTFVQSLVDQGVITVEEARTHPKRNVVSNTIANGRSFERNSIGVSSIRLKEGDIVLSFSDGIVDPLTHYNELKSTLEALSLSSSPIEIAKKIRDQALDRAKKIEKAENKSGSIDNISVVAYGYYPAGAPESFTPGILQQVGSIFTQDSFVSEKVESVMSSLGIKKK